PDDGHPGGAALLDAPFDLMADRILIRPEPPGEHLAENHDTATLAAIGVREKLSAFQRDAERFEVAARRPRRGDHATELRRRLRHRIRREGPALLNSQRAIGAARGGADTGDGAGGLDRLLVERFDLRT